MCVARDTICSVTHYARRMFYLLCKRSKQRKFAYGHVIHRMLLHKFLLRRRDYYVMFIAKSSIINN